MKNLLRAQLLLLATTGGLNAMIMPAQEPTPSASASNTTTVVTTVVAERPLDNATLQRVQAQPQEYPKTQELTIKTPEPVVLVDNEKSKATAKLTVDQITTSEKVSDDGKMLITETKNIYSIEINSLDKAAEAQYEKNVAANSGKPQMLVCGGPGPNGWNGQHDQSYSIQARDNDRAVVGTSVGGHYGTCPCFVTYVFHKNENKLTNEYGDPIDDKFVIQALAHFWDSLPIEGNVDAFLKELTPEQLQARKKQQALQLRAQQKQRAQQAKRTAKKHKAKKHDKVKHLKATVGETAPQPKAVVLKGRNGAGIYHRPAVAATEALQPATTEAASQPVVTQDASSTGAATGN